MLLVISLLILPAAFYTRDSPSKQRTKNKDTKAQRTKPKQTLVSIINITLAKMEIVSEFIEVVQSGRQSRSVHSRNIGGACFCDGDRLGVGFSSFCSDVAGDNGSHHSK